MTAVTNEIDLLEASLRGNKDAFGTIVENYQSLVCSITYSATGDFAKSEEIAQETFIRAWKELKQLKDLGKFRAWLCTITRNLLRQSIKKRTEDVLDTAQPIENAIVSETTEMRPDHIAITKEQQTVIWQALQEIPETYREPMVLFYRKQQSIKEVASKLELSEEVTKQRLARGRKLLKTEMSTLVEDILGKTSPKKNFTIAVIAALPTLSSKTASASIAGGAAAKGINTITIGSMMSSLESFIMPLLIWWGGSNYYKAALENATTEKERSVIKRWHIIEHLYCSLLPLAVLLFAFTKLRRYGNLIWFLIPAYFIGIFILAYFVQNKLKALQIKQRTYIEPEERVKSKRLIYGEFSFIFGWLLIINFVSIKAHDWFAVWFTLIVVVGIFIISTRISLNKQQYYNQIIYLATASIGILALVIFNLRWHKWIMELPKYRKYSLGKVNLFICGATITIILLMILSEYYQKWRRAKSHNTDTE